MPIKLEKLSNFGRRPIINNADYYNTDWIPAEEDYFLCPANDITVYNHPKFEGGSQAIGKTCLEVMQILYPNRVFNNAMEWACGPGYIGFLFLANGICNNLTLSDIYRPALRAVEKTIENLPEKYQGHVDWFHIRNPADIPVEKQFDFIIGSPPHWDVTDDKFVNKIFFNDRRSADPDWLVHEAFFREIKKNLAPDGIILLQEQAYACGPDTFQEMVTAAGLKITDCYWEPDDLQNNLHCFYLEVMHA